MVLKQAPESSHDAQKEPIDSPFLIIGLGNPGRAYRRNRHNIGFMVLDHLAERLDTRFARLQTKALVTDARHNGRRLILAKPQTFMNESGQAARSLVRFYKIPLTQMLVIHDDIDVPFGTFRMRPTGGSGGQKGLGSIINQLGSSDFPRLRIGIGRPAGRMDPADYVLQNFTSAETEVLPLLLEHGARAALAFVLEGIQASMTRYNGNVL